MRSLLQLRLPPAFFRPAVGFGVAAIAYAAQTVALAPFLGEDQIVDVALLYLLLTLVVAALWGYWVGLTGGLAADLLLNFFFVPPVRTLTVQEPANVVALLEFLAVALVGASMLSLLRRQVRIASARRAETEVLLSLSREVARAVSPRDAMDRLCAAGARALKARGCSIARQGDHWEVVGSSGGLTSLPREEEAVAAEAVRTDQIARLGIGGERRQRTGAPSRQSPVTFVPFGPAASHRGVLRISGTISGPPMADMDQLLRAFADEAGVAMDRAALAEEARRVEALQRADELKSILLSSVSHDLRSPLTAIKAAVGSLRDDSVAWSQEDTTSFLATIETQTDRLTATVNNLLEMSRLEGGAVKPDLESVEAGPLFEEVALAVAQVTAGRTVRVETSPGLWLRADYGLLTQALQNLVENAAKYSRPGGSIVLGGETAGGRVTLLVADEGPGISQEDLPHIFEKFYRGSRTGATKGVGLGLSIVKAMVELCGGRIHVRSSEGGTVFRIDLPAAPSPRR